MEAEVNFFEGQPDGYLVRTPDEAGRIIEACYSNSVTAALLYPQNLPAAFFDLSSGEAGAILQKLRTYRVRLAVVCPGDTVHFSTHFHEIAVEERRNHYFGVFPSREAACEWLAEVSRVSSM